MVSAVAVAAPAAGPDALSDRKLARAFRRAEAQERAATTRRRRAATAAGADLPSALADAAREEEGRRQMLGGEAPAVEPAEPVDLAEALGVPDEGGAPDAPVELPAWLRRIAARHPEVPQQALDGLAEDDYRRAVEGGERYDADSAVRARVRRLEKLVGADTNIDDAALAEPDEPPAARKIRNGRVLSPEAAEAEASGVPTPRQHRIGSVPVAANDERVEPIVESSFWRNGMLVWANPDLEREAAERLEREAVLAERAAEEARRRAGANAPLYAALASLGPDAGGAILLALQLLTEAAKDHPSGLGPRFEQCRAELEPFIEEGTADGR